MSRAPPLTLRCSPILLNRPFVESYRAVRAYPEALAAIATLRSHVDLFFDKVMVMIDQPDLRANRLALIALVLAEFSRVADFSEMGTQA